MTSDKKYFISEEQLESLIEFITNRNLLQAKRVLNELKEYIKPKPSEDKSLRSKLERLIRNSGRTNVVTINELKGILNEE